MRTLDYGLVFDSWGEFVNAAEVNPSDVPERYRSSRRVDKGFRRVTEFKEAVEMARYGWAWGEARANHIADDMFVAVSEKIERSDVTYGVEGMGIDVGRYLSGEPEYWQKYDTVYVNQESGYRLIHVVFNMAASWTIKQDVIVARGAQVAALIQLLEFAGHSVQLDLVQSIRTSGHRRFESERFKNKCNDFEVWVRVKDFGQPIDMTRSIFALAHPATLRSLMFSFSETLSKGLRDVAGITYGGYGIPSEVDEARRGDVYINKSLGGEIQWTDPTAARNWIVDSLQSQGVVVKDDDLFIYV